MIKLVERGYMIIHSREPKEISAEQAAKALHVPQLIFDGHLVEADTLKEKAEVVKEYVRLYKDELNKVKHVDDEDNNPFCYVSENNRFYVHNVLFHFRAGTRPLDPRYAKYNAYAAEFSFTLTPLAHFLGIPKEAGALLCLHKDTALYLLERHDSVNYSTLSESLCYLNYAWDKYKCLFQENVPQLDLEKIMDINKEFNLPWYDRKRWEYEHYEEMMEFRNGEIFVVTGDEDKKDKYIKKAHI